MLLYGAEIWILKKYENEFLITEMIYLKRSVRISILHKNSVIREKMDKDIIQEIGKIQP